MTQMKPEERPELEVHPADSAHRSRKSSASVWKTPPLAAGIAFVGVRLLRVGLAAKLLKLGFRLGRGPAGKIARSFAAKKLADRKRQ